MWVQMSKPGKQIGEVESRHRIGLTGRFDRQLDPKKRLTIPSVWREALGPDRVYVMPAPQGKCLQLIPVDVMESRLSGLAEASLWDAELNMILDKIGENSELLDFDVQGRIRISDRLLAYAGLKGSVVLKGSFRLATIHAADATPAEGAVDEKGLDAAMSALKKRGIAF